MRVEILSQAFDPWACLQQAEQSLQMQYGQCGAMANFIGKMRNHNEGDKVTAMFLEHYPGMTEHHLEKLSDAAHQRWSLLDTLIVHRVGDIYPGETIVLVAVWATHRAPALDACRYLIEALKQQAPFWKRETLAQGSRWVSHNPPGSIT